MTFQIPTALRGRPFTRSKALDHGVTARQLRGLRYTAMFRGVYRCRDDDPSLVMWVCAALLLLPKDAVISHVTALWWYGVEVGRQFPLHSPPTAPTAASSGASGCIVGAVAYARVSSVVAR